MKKHCIRLVLTLALVACAFASSVSAAETCTRETGWRDANGNPLDCYTCGTGDKQVTYCYPAQ